MSEHPNVTTVDKMTCALVEQDKDTLVEVLHPEIELHLRGPWQGAGDFTGVDGVVGAIGAIFEFTGGQVDLQQQFCIGVDGWAAEFEHSQLGHDGKTLESKNAFVYRFDGGRIAEMWMFLGADPAAAQAWQA